MTALGSKIRILVCASTFPSSSSDTSARFILDQCKCLASTGKYECIVLAPHSAGACTSETMEGIEVHRFRYFIEILEVISGNGIVAKIRSHPLLLTLVPFFFISEVYALVRLAHRKNIDLILANWILPQGLAAVIANYFLGRNRPKILLFSLGGDVALVERLWFFQLLCKYIVKRVDCIVAVSSFIKTRLLTLLQLDSNAIEIIRMGVDENLFKLPVSVDLKPRSTTGASLLFVGRLEEKKGLDFLLNAMPQVISVIPSARLKIVGDGTLIQEMIALVAHLDLTEQVQFLGSLSHTDLRPLYAMANVLIAPSVNTAHDYEGLPVSVLEAIVSGTPVVCTDAGGITDIIEDQVTGILCPQRDSPALARGIIKLLDNSLFASEISMRALERLKKEFTYTEIFKSYDRLIAKVFSESSV